MKPADQISLPPWQFQLSKEASAGARPLGAFFLRLGDGIPVVDVTDAAGSPQGVLVGFVIDLERKHLLKDGETYRSLTARGQDPDAFAESLLEELGGAFVWLWIAEDVARIYPDCGATVPVVWDEGLSRAGMTATAILDDEAYQERFDHGLYDRLRIGKDGYFPAGLTTHQGVKRLLANHMLDLSDWSTRRFWPKGPIPTVPDPEAAVDDIIALVRAQLEALLASDRKVGQALTAGHETRMLLGIAKPFIKDMDFITVVGSDRHAMDTIIARKIANTMGLTHKELPRVRGTAEARERFIRRGGHSMVDSNSWYAPSVHPIAESHWFIGGLGGELARAFFWHESDTSEVEITPERLLNRFGLPQEPVLRDALAQWLKDVPSDDALDILDLAYIEHRMGPWSGAQFPCDPTLMRFAPLYTRQGSTLMLGLPADWKRAEKMSSVAVARTWPELAQFPYNNAGLWVKIMDKSLRILKDPGLILRKLRKMRR